MSDASAQTRIVVLDSSAMLAYVKNELGGPFVASLLGDEDVTAYAHAVNLAEVFYDFGPPSSAQNLANSQKAIAVLEAAGVVERADLDGPFWRDVALLIAERRAHAPDAAKPKQKPRLALGDAFGVALARRLGGEFVTADRAEIEPIHAAGFCRATFIR